MTPKSLPQRALDKISARRFTNDTATDGDSESREPQTCRTAIDGKIRTVPPTTRTQGTGKDFFVIEAVFAPKLRRRVSDSAGVDRQGARRIRPRARRALIIRRPALVFIRARKPCLRARFNRPG